MFSRKRLAQVVRALAMFASLALIAATSLGAPSTPFKGRGNGHDLSVIPQADGIHISAVVEGEATHLGHFTEQLDYVLAYDFVHFAGLGTFTAANGDKVFVTFAGSIPGFISGVFPMDYSSVFTVTGGTGRFRDATGGGQISGIDFGGGLFNAEWQGTLAR